MRASLKWALGLSSVASAVALLWPAGEPEAPLQPPTSAIPGTSSRESRTSQVAALPIYSTTKVLALQATHRDPFATLNKPMLEVAPVIAPPAPPPPPPVAPPLGYRYLGSFTGPDGSREVYLTRADRAVSVKPGSQLEGGYVVESINATRVNVLHLATQTKVDIPIAQNKESP